VVTNKKDSFPHTAAKLSYAKPETALHTCLPLKAMETARNCRIALVGLRGAGKSTLGRRLADDLSYPFI